MEREDLLIDALWKMLARRRAMDKTVWRQAANDLNPTELRCIEYVGDHTHTNATRLAEGFFMTTGATSKLTKKLLAKGYLVRYQEKMNRKEVYFRLSDEGNKLYNTVSGIRQSLRHRDAPFFETMTTDEYDTILSFVQRYDDYLHRLKMKQPSSGN